MKTYFFIGALTIIALLLSGCKSRIPSSETERTAMTAIEVSGELPPPLTLDEIQAQSDGSFQVRYDAGSGRIKQIDGYYSPVVIQQCGDAVRSLASVQEIMDIQSLEFALISEDRSRDGLLVFTLRQLYHGIEVYSGVMQVISTTDGRAVSVSGLYVQDITVDPTPRLTSDRALSSYQANQHEQISSAQLEIYADAHTSPCLCWSYQVTSSNLSMNRKIYLSADDGTLLGETYAIIN